MKCEEQYEANPDMKSHPSRVRGLKSARAWQSLTRCLSHPSRVRGLKWTDTRPSNGWNVAPFAGAWIEILGVLPYF